MNFQKYVDQLENKWGTLIRMGDSFVNGRMTFISDVAQLNVMFSPLKNQEIEQIEMQLGTLPSQLKQLYKQTNGCRLFFGSLNILGVRKYSDDLFEPYGIVEENFSVHNEMIKNSCEDSNLVFIASLAGDYFFAHKKEETDKIYCVKRGSSTVLKEFNDLEEMFDYYFTVLYNEYGSDCKKIHIKPEDKDIPVIAHLSCDFF